MCGGLTCESGAGGSEIRKERMEALQAENARLAAQVSSLESRNASLEAELGRTEEEFKEFQSSSKELEAELERQCEDAERQVRQLRDAAGRAAMERERDSAGAAESRRTIQRLERELEETQSERDELRKTIRELEQANDDLERAKRNALESIRNLEKGMDDMIEHKAMLENEKEESEALKSSYQRLRDETRELKEELKVRERKPAISPAAATAPSPSRPRASTSRPAEPMDTTVSPAAANGNMRSGIPRSMTIDCGGPTSPSPAINPSTRINALNIVGDLLRKVGALESRLASARMKYPASSAPDDGSPRGPQAKQPHLSHAIPGPPSRLPLPKTSPPKLK